MTELVRPGSRARRSRSGWVLGLASIAVSIVVFVVPFAFILLTAAKGRAEASRLDFTWPSEWQLWQNIVDVVQARDFMLVTAFVNSTVLTVVSVTIPHQKARGMLPNFSGWASLSAQ